MLPSRSASEASVSQSQNSLFLSRDDLALILDLLRNSPSELTDDQVRKISLPSLTESLGQQLSSRIIIDTYLRWLEIQRQAPAGGYNSIWQVVLTSWTKSLRARGFSLPEVTREVEKWKAANSPLKISRTIEAETRLPPSASQLALSWKETPQETSNLWPCSRLSSRAYTQLSDKMYDKLLTPAPSYYVCHRCNGKGHYVRDCPTNEDPTYDLAPGDDYQCRHCQQSGDHYFLFCPKNPDPNSVYKRRQAKIQSETFEHGSVKSCFACSPETSWRVDQLSSSPCSPLSASLNEEGTPVPKCNLLRPCATTMSPGIPIEDPFTEHVSKMGTINSSHYTNTDDKICPSDLLRREIPLPIWKRCVIETELPLLPQPVIYRGNPITSPQGIDDYERAWRMERSRKNLRRESRKGGWNQGQTTSRPVIDYVSSSSLPESNQKEFLAKLFFNFPSEVRKVRKFRLTAMDMWQMSDARKLQEGGNNSDQQMSYYVFTDDQLEGSSTEDRGSEENERLSEPFRQGWRDGEARETEILENRTQAARVNIWEVSDGRKFKEEAGRFMEEMADVATPITSPRELEDAIKDLFAEPRRRWDDDETRGKCDKTNSERRNQLLRDTMIQRGRIWVQHLELKLLDYQQSRLGEISCHELGISPLSRSDPTGQKVQEAVQKMRRGMEKATKQLENVAVLRGRLDAGQDVDGALMESMTSKSIAKQYVQYISEGY